MTAPSSWRISPLGPASGAYCANREIPKSLSPM
jgi:hypothetical protein